MTGGKTNAMVTIVPYVEQVTRDAAEQATTGHITPDLADLLIAARSGHVHGTDGLWVRDVSFWARVARHAGLASVVGDAGRPVLRLTGAGRQAVTRIYADRMLGELHRASVAYQQGYRFGYDVARDELADRRPAWRRALTRIAPAVMFTVGTLLGVLATWALIRPAGR